MALSESGRLRLPAWVGWGQRSVQEEDKRASPEQSQDGGQFCSRTADVRGGLSWVFQLLVII